MKKFAIYINKKNDLIAFLVGGLSLFGFIFMKTIISEYLFLVGGIIGGIPIVIKAIEALKVKVISIELLVSIAIIGGLLIGEFEESAMVSFLFLFGTFLEQKILKKTRNSIRKLVDMAPKTANVKIDNNIVETEVDDLKIGDVIVINTGGQVPIDGVVVDGIANVNQAAITGESKLQSVQNGTRIFAGSIVDNGTIEVKTSKIGEDTTLGKIIELVEEAQDSKSPSEKFIDRFAKYYTPTVLVIALIVFVVTRDIKLSITLLVLGCPGALVIGTPVSMVVGIGNGASHGVLLQGGNAVSQMANIKTFIFDKTNTLTEGKMKVDEVITYSKLTKEERKVIASMENSSEHPLAKAVMEYLATNETKNLVVETIKGQGLKYKNYLIGNEKLVNISVKQQIELKEIQKRGSSTVLISINGELKVILGISDVIKDDAKESLINLRRLGADDLVIFSGDNNLAVHHVGNKLQVDTSLGELLPDEKLEYVKQYQSTDSVAFIGDGINDSPSLASADIGIAMGNGTDVAIETSDVILVNSTLSNLVYAYALSKKTLNNVKQNIFIAVATVVLLLSGSLFGVINMASGMLFHELSILIVIVNAMRLSKYNFKN